jgi:hypothetical protein
VRFLALKGFIISQYDESIISHSSFSFLQRLLFKVSYATFYRKHCKERGNCHNPILGYSPKFTFFQNKNQKNKIKAGNVEKAGRGIKL